MVKLHHPLVGIIIPLEDESIFLHKNIYQSESISIGGVNYYLGKISDKDIVFVNSGLGKVNSSVIAARLIGDFHPTLLLLSGTSGSLNHHLKVGEVIIGKSVMDADLGMLTANGIQFPYNPYLYNPQKKSTLPLLFQLESSLKRMLTELIDTHWQNTLLGKIATSDALPNQQEQIKLLQEAEFDIIEMEGSAVMQTCWLLNTACVVVRGVSNKVGDIIMQQNIQFAADNANKIVISIISNYKI